MGRLLRSELFSDSEVSIVHAVQRCVRRAFLAGVDHQTGKDYGFRREWIRRRMEALASVFGIDVLTYAVLSNHMHLILRNRPDIVAQWSDQDVAIRWLKVFPGRRLGEHLGEPTQNDVDRLVQDQQRLAEIRRRLSDISWFMRALSEPIARMANKQDECTGRFWEGRFKAQPITDEAGLLAYAMYVDLNPVRAALAETPDTSQHTSAYDRIQANKGQCIPAAAFDLVPTQTEEMGTEVQNTPVEKLQEKRRVQRKNPTGKRIRRDAWLAPLTLDQSSTTNDPQPHGDGLRASNKGFLKIALEDYLGLLRWTAKQREPGLTKEAPPRLKPLLAGLGIDLSMWRDLVWNFKRYFGGSSCAGSPHGMSSFATTTGRNWVKGQRGVAACFICQQAN